jgi:hypothetical protein
MINFRNIIISDYPDIISVIDIPLIIAIFAFAFPLLFQIASRVDDKYESTVLVKTYRNDWICRIFLSLLIFSLVLCLIWILQLRSCINLGNLNLLIESSALILVSISSMLLTASTFGIIWLIYIYYVPEKLLKRLIHQYGTAKGKRKPIYFIAISKIMIYAIRSNDKKLSFETLNFFNKEFSQYRKTYKVKVIVYPIEYYNVIYESNEVLYAKQQIEISYFNESVLIGLLIDRSDGTIISEKTYNEIWKGMRQALYYNRNEFIIAYWRMAHQYFLFNIKPIDRRFDDKFEVINIDDINARNNERERFLEFHYALGALLLYKEKYSLLKNIMMWTNQFPPKYLLVPEMMEEVIIRFMELSLENINNSLRFQMNYPFPDIDGVNAEMIIQMWLKRYLSILFLRQYTLNEYYTYSHPLEMPSIPENQSEKKRWNDNLDSLKYFVDDYLSQQNVMRQLGLGVLCEDNWFSKNRKEKPDDLIDKYKQRIEKGLDDDHNTQEIDEEKLSSFKETSKKIIANTYKEYEFFTKNTINGNFKSIFLGGRYQLIDKDAFGSNPELYLANSESIVAELVSGIFMRDVLNIFIYYKRTQYYLEANKIFEAIDSLNLDKSTFSILAIGININFYKDSKEITKDNQELHHNEVPIINLYTSNSLFNHSFIIIKNDDLPCMVHHSIPAERMEKYELEVVDEKNHTYASVIDLNKTKNDILSKEIRGGTSVEGDLSKYVLACVDINTEVRCNKMPANIIQINTFYQLGNSGKPNEVSDVNNVW